METPQHENGHTHVDEKKPIEETASTVHHTQPPVHEMVGGSSVRQYLNKNVTPHLLEGLKKMAQSKPDDPLRELGEFLIARSEKLKSELTPK